MISQETEGNREGAAMDQDERRRQRIAETVRDMVTAAPPDQHQWP